MSVMTMPELEASGEPGPDRDGRRHADEAFQATVPFAVTIVPKALVSLG